MRRSGVRLPWAAPVSSLSKLSMLSISQSRLVGRRYSRSSCRVTTVRALNQFARHAFVQNSFINLSSRVLNQFNRRDWNRMCSGVFAAGKVQGWRCATVDWGGLSHFCVSSKVSCFCRCNIRCLAPSTRKTIGAAKKVNSAPRTRTYSTPLVFDI
jgi:hypothetical protein